VKFILLTGVVIGLAVTGRMSLSSRSAPPLWAAIECPGKPLWLAEIGV